MLEGDDHFSDNGKGIISNCIGEGKKTMWIFKLIWLAMHCGRWTPSGWMTQLCSWGRLKKWTKNDIAFIVRKNTSTSAFEYNSVSNWIISIWIILIIININWIMSTWFADNPLIWWLSKPMLQLLIWRRGSWWVLWRSSIWNQQNTEARPVVCGYRLECKNWK